MKNKISLIEKIGLGLTALAVGSGLTGYNVQAQEKEYKGNSWLSGAFRVMSLGAKNARGATFGNIVADSIDRSDRNKAIARRGNAIYINGQQATSNDLEYVGFPFLDSEVENGLYDKGEEIKHVFAPGEEFVLGFAGKKVSLGTELTLEVLEKLGKEDSEEWKLVYTRTDLVGKGGEGASGQKMSYGKEDRGKVHRVDWKVNGKTEVSYRVQAEKEE